MILINLKGFFLYFNIYKLLNNYKFPILNYYVFYIKYIF